VVKKEEEKENRGTAKEVFLVKGEGGGDVVADEET